MILQARTVFLPKSDKVVNQGVAPKDVRPITILSVWWRLFCSAWLKRDITSNWLKHILHKDVVYGKGSDAQVGAATVLQHFQQYGYMCSLDYTKCFDLLRPVASKQLLDASGCCPHMSTLCVQMWSKHVRWPSWNGFLGNNPLDTKGLSIPQGDPLGPMLAALWLSSGQRFVEENSHDPNGCTVIYMDDRTFSTCDVSRLQARRDAWVTWSGKVGLCENLQKSQVTARSATQKRSLQEFFPSDLIVTDILFLGVTSRSTKRTNSGKETDRLKAAQKIIGILAGLKLGSQVVSTYVRIFGLSKCTFGWLARLPTWTDCNKLWVGAKHAQNVNHMANTWIRALVFGGLNHLSIVSVCNLWRVVSTLYKRGHDTWRYQAGTPLGTLRKWLYDHGWIVQNHWIWKFGDTSLTVSIEHDTKYTCHQLRDGFKLFCWDKFLHTSRHEISDVQHVTWKELLAVDWKGIRKKADVDPAYRAVVCGATVSPAWFQHCNTFPTSCVWCSELGTWHHIAWECQSCPWSRPPEPLSGVAWRFGWFVILKMTMMSLITLVSVNKPSGIPDGVQRSDFATLGGLLASRRRTCAVCQEADARKTTTTITKVVSGIFCKSLRTNGQCFWLFINLLEDVSNIPENDQLSL